MKEILELMFRDQSTTIASIIIILILASLVYRFFDSLFKNVLKPMKTKTKIKKIYVDEFGDEIEK